MCRSSLPEDMRSSGTFKDTAILLATNGFASRHLTGVCWISTATHSLRTSLRERGRIYACAPCSPGPRISFSGGPNSGCIRKRGSMAANVGEGLVPHRCSSVGWELQAYGKTLGVIRADSQPNQCNCCMVSR